MSSNLGMIINDMKKNCYLSIVNSARFLNFTIIEKKNTVKYRKNSIKKVYYNYILVDKKLRPNILYRCKILENSNNIF